MTENKTELLPCPFCGGAAIGFFYDPDIGLNEEVRCTKCKAKVYGLLKDKVIKAWNTRATPERSELPADKGVWVENSRYTPKCCEYGNSQSFDHRIWKKPEADKAETLDDLNQLIHFAAMKVGYDEANSMSSTIRSTLQQDDGKPNWKLLPEDVGSFEFIDVVIDPIARTVKGLADDQLVKALKQISTESMVDIADSYNSCWNAAGKIALAALAVHRSKS